MQACRKCAPATFPDKPWNRRGFQCAEIDNEDDNLEDYDRIDLDDAEEANDVGFVLSHKPFVSGPDALNGGVEVSLADLQSKIGPEEYLVVWRDSDGTWMSEGNSDNPPYHKRLKEVLAGKEHESAELLRSKFSQFTLRATEDMEEWTPIGRDTGALWTLEEWEAMAKKEQDPSFGLMATDIPKRLFKPLKVPMPDLVQDASTHGNMYRFLQDPAWHKHGGFEHEKTPNVGTFVVITPEAPHVQVVYFTMRDVEEGEELTISWGDAPWDQLLNARLVEYSQIARSHHAHLTLLEGILLAHNLTAPPAPPKPRAEGVVYLSQLDENESAIPPTTSTSAARRVLQAIQKGKMISKEEVAARTAFEVVSNPFERTGVEALYTIDASNLPDSVTNQLRQCQTTGNDYYHWHAEYADLLRTIVDGAPGCDAYIAIAVDKSEFSPINLFTPPSMTPYSAIAKAAIRKGWPIVEYSGRLVLDDDVEATNHYLYEVSAVEMLRREYDGPPLLVDPETKGGPARWINDDWTPRGLPKRQPNCYVELVFDESTDLPHLIWFASSDIKAGDELIGSYGPRYWRHVFKDLMKALTEDTLEMRHKCDHLKQWLQSNHPELVPVSSSSARSSRDPPPPKRVRVPSSSSGAGSSRDPSPPKRLRGIATKTLPQQMCA